MFYFNQIDFFLPRQNKENSCKHHVMMSPCHNSFPGRPYKAGAKMDNSCCRASLDREHVGSLSLDQWVKDKQVKGCIRLEVCKLTRRAQRIPRKVAS